MDRVIASKELQIERKHFSIELRENDRGEFLRITEQTNRGRNMIIVPQSGLEEFADAIDELVVNDQ